MTLSRWTPKAQWLVSMLFLAVCRRSQSVPAEPPPDTVGGTTEVETIEVIEQLMPRALMLTGTLRASQQTNLAANATGRVQRTFVERGTEVKQGDLLATVDVRGAALSAAEARVNVALARAHADAATRECSRYQRLRQEDAVPASEFERMSDACRTSPLSIEAAQARAHSIAIAVSDGAIRAPFAGVITEKHVEPGEYLRADSPVVSLVALDPLRLDLTVPEVNLAALRVGGDLTFTVPTYPARQFVGTVRDVGPAVRETTRDVVAEAIVDNRDHTLRRGMFATVSLFVGDQQIPRESGESRGKTIVVRRGRADGIWTRRCEAA